MPEPLHELDFKPAEVFDQTFMSVAAHISDVLHGPPTGPKYMSAMETFHFLGTVLDRIFHNWGSLESRSKFSKLKESSSQLQKLLSSHPGCRELLSFAGFEKQEEANLGGTLWILT